MLLLNALCHRIAVVATASGAETCDPERAYAILALVQSREKVSPAAAFITCEPTNVPWPPRKSRIMISPAAFLPAPPGDTGSGIPVRVSLWQLTRALQRTHILLCDSVCADVASRRARGSADFVVVERSVVALKSVISALAHAAARSSVKSEETTRLLSVVDRVTDLISLRLQSRSKFSAAVATEGIVLAWSRLYVTGGVHATLQPAADASFALAADWLPALVEAAALIELHSRPPATPSAPLEIAISVGATWLKGAARWLDWSRRLSGDSELGGPSLRTVFESAKPDKPRTHPELQRFASRGLVPTLIGIVQMGAAIENRMRTVRIPQEGAALRRTKLAVDALSAATCQFVFSWIRVIPEPARSRVLLETWGLRDLGLLADVVSRLLLTAPGGSVDVGAKSRFVDSQLALQCKALIHDVSSAALQALGGRESEGGRDSHASSSPGGPGSRDDKFMDTADDLNTVLRLCSALHRARTPLHSLEISTPSGCISALDVVVGVFESASAAARAHALSRLTWYESAILDAVADPAFSPPKAPIDAAKQARPARLSHFDDQVGQLSSAADTIAQAGEADLALMGSLAPSTRQLVQKLIRRKGPYAVAALLDAMSPDRVAARGTKPSTHIRFEYGDLPGRRKESTTIEVVASDFLGSLEVTDVNAAGSRTRSWAGDSRWTEDLDDIDVDLRRPSPLDAADPLVLATGSGRDADGGSDSDGSSVTLVGSPAARSGSHRGSWSDGESASDSDGLVGRAHADGDLDDDREGSRSFVDSVPSAVGALDVRRDILLALFELKKVVADIDLCGLLPFVQLPSSALRKIDEAMRMRQDQSEGLGPARLRRPVELVLSSQHRRAISELIRALEESAELANAADDDGTAARRGRSLVYGAAMRRVHSLVLLDPASDRGDL